MLSIVLAKNIASLFLIMFIGAMSVKFGLLKVDDNKILSAMMLYVVSPCTILSAFQIEYTESTSRNLLMSFSAGTIVFVMYLLLTLLLRKPLKLSSLERVSVIYSNAGNLIIPLVSSIFGKDWVLFCCAYMTVNTIFLWTHGMFVLNKTSVGSWKKAILNVNIISIATGITLFICQIRMPAIIATALDQVGSMVGPLAMLIMGVLLSEIDFKKVFSYRRLWLVLGIRLVVFPLIAMLLLKYSPIHLMSVDGKQILLITLLGAAAPAAANLPMMAQTCGQDACYGSIINVSSTLLCIISMPLIVYLYQM